MNELSPLARGVIDVARNADDPTDADRHDMTSRLQRKLGAAALAGATVSTSATALGAASAAAKLSTGLFVSALSWALGGVMAGVVVMTGAALLGNPLRPTAVIPRDPPPSGLVSMASPAAVAVPATPQPALTSETPPLPTKFGDRLAAAPTTNGPTASTSRASTLDAEVVLLREANAALQSGDSRRALVLLDQHAARFHQGALAEERAAQRVFALCQSGRTDEASAEAREFLRAAPRSPLAARVRSSCGVASGR